RYQHSRLPAPVGFADQVPQDVRRYAHDPGVAKWHESEVATEQIDAHREQSEIQDLRGDCEIVGTRHVRQRQSDHTQHDYRGEARAHHRQRQLGRPNNPWGRHARMMTIGANNVKYSRSGTSAVAKASMSPTSRLPTIAPSRLPGPPMITTTTARSRISESD